MNSTSVDELVEQARHRTPGAIDALVLKVQPQVYRFCLRTCRNPDDAEDVFQETMLTMVRNLSDFRGESALTTWLFVIARNIWIKQQRRSRFAKDREESLSEISSDDRHALQSDVPDPEAEFHTKELWQQVEQGIAALSPDYREVLVLRDIEGLAAKEVAEVVNISVSAVKSRLHRARAELRESISGAPPSKVGCPDIRRFFSEHLEGELSSSLCAQMEEHVEICTQCARECDGLKATLSVCASAPLDVPPRVVELLRRALLGS